MALLSNGNFALVHYYKYNIIPLIFLRLLVDSLSIFLVFHFDLKRKKKYNCYSGKVFLSLFFWINFLFVCVCVLRRIVFLFYFNSIPHKFSCSTFCADSLSLGWSTPLVLILPSIRTNGAWRFFGVFGHLVAFCSSVFFLTSNIYSISFNVNCILRIVMSCAVVHAIGGICSTGRK